MTRSRRRLFHVTAIPARQLLAHQLLSGQLEALLAGIETRRDGAALAGMQLALARQAMADLARLISREPGNRALLRLPPGPAVPQAEACAALRDGLEALAAFRAAHSDIDSDREDGWLLLPSRRSLPR